jgi:hypothetical protein
MVFEEAKMRPLIGCVGCAALVVAVGGCAPMVQSDLPNGDHVVTTYVRVQGAEEAQNDNLWAARQRCHGGIVLISETSGVDANGAWQRLVYGCLAHESAGLPAPR